MSHLQTAVAADTPAVRPVERRFLIRYPVKSGARVLRDSDFVRIGIEATLRRLTAAGLELEMEIAPHSGEQVKILLHNEIQRLSKEVRGIVRHVMPLPDGRYRVELELFNRLSPLEVAMLRMSIRDPAQSGPRWV